VGGEMEQDYKEKSERNERSEKKTGERKEMIDIKINMIPFGQLEYGRLIGAVHISNDATGTRTKGNYRYKLVHKGRVYREGTIKGFPRQRKNVMWLLKMVLADALNE